ncbi:uncharacterized protein VTP21DRAFT_5595 [Calcarisporiella thermophila]|uniref:uncharacterized protein n=1 Tax=Calcarisporiella thermophila TaxID=911321 RepID=UPI003744ABD8
MSESIGPSCTELKHRYDACFNRWYSEKFLKGNLDQSECEEVFKDYKTCVMMAVKQKQIDKLLAEARQQSPLPNASANKES